MKKRGKMPQPKPRLCRDCESWKKSDGTSVRVCNNPRSPENFTNATTADHGCTPHKRAKEGWI